MINEGIDQLEKEEYSANLKQQKFEGAAERSKLETDLRNFESEYETAAKKLIRTGWLNSLRTASKQKSILRTYNDAIIEKIIVTRMVRAILIKEGTPSHKVAF